MQNNRWARAPLSGFLHGLATCALVIAVSPAYAAQTVYTLDGEFDQGVLQGVNHDNPNNNQLQLSTIGSTFPRLWVASAGEDTLSKIDTTTNKELARYRTFRGSGSFTNHTAFGGPAPSRSAVDINGNAYILNRHFDGRAPTLMKVLNEGFIDRNSNSVIDTSTDADNSGTISSTETKDLLDTNPTNDMVDQAEIQDERVAWVTKFPASENGQLGRALCIGTDGNLWAGMYSSARYYKIQASDGAILSGPHTVPWTPYGCLVDGNGILWSASLGTRLGRLDTNAPATTAFFDDSSSANYGIALGNGKVYLGSQSGFGFREFDPATSLFTTPGGSKGFSSLGISVDGAGNIWTGPYQFGGVSKYSPAGTALCSGPNQFVGSIETRGVIVDADNNIWQINRFTNNVSKYRGTDCTPLGVVPVGFDPYTYSDATGFTALNTTTPTGTWTVIKDGGSSGTVWTKIDWTEQTPNGASVVVSVRASDVQANLANLPFVPVTDGANPNVTGRFIQIQTRLTANSSDQSPILLDLLVQSADTVCRVDGDADIDNLDLALISKARGQTALPGDPRDANRNGFITAADVKLCIKLCTRPNCATQ